MKRTYVIRNGKAVEITRDVRKGIEIMPDIQPYQSMITGEMIGSRSTHRNHLRQHNCIEVGNETDKQFHAYDDLHSHLDKSRHEQVVSQFRDMSDREFRETVRRSVKQARGY